LALLSVLTAAAQQPAGPSAQSNPGSSQTQAPQPQQPAPQPQQPGPPSSIQETTAVFIGYATNRSFLFPDIATSPGPLPVGGKFKLFANQSISPPYVFLAAFSAAINQARNIPQGYGQGWDSYASRFGANMARASSSSFFGTFLFASMLHQDPRFFPQSKPSLGRSAKYSLQRIVITRNDAGKDVFNTSGLLGPLAGESLANTYLPSAERTVAKTAERYAIDMAWRFGANMLKDYWPTLFHNMGLNRLKVIPDPGEPGEPGTHPN
jgi:hypothetical protein